MSRGGGTRIDYPESVAPPGQENQVTNHPEGLIKADSPRSQSVSHSLTHSLTPLIHSDIQPSQRGGRNPTIETTTTTKSLKNSDK
jgi:hypothetical protein